MGGRHLQLRPEKADFLALVFRPGPRLRVTASNTTIQFRPRKAPVKPSNLIIHQPLKAGALIALGRELCAEPLDREL